MPANSTFGAAEDPAARAGAASGRARFDPSRMPGAPHSGSRPAGRGRTRRRIRACLFLLGPAALAAALAAAGTGPLPLPGADAAREREGPGEAAGAIPAAPAAGRRDGEAFARAVLGALERDPAALLRLVRSAMAEERAQALRASWKAQAAGPALEGVAGVPLGTVRPGALPVTVFTSFGCAYCRAAHRALVGREDLSLSVRFLPGGGSRALAARAFLRLAGRDRVAAAAFFGALMALESSAWEENGPGDTAAGMGEDGGFAGRSGRARLAALAAEYGLDAGEFAALATAPDLSSRLAEDAAAAGRLGVRGTPTFVLGDRVLVRGLVAPELFEEAVAAAAGAAAPGGARGTGPDTAGAVGEGPRGERGAVPAGGRSGE